MKQMGWKIPMTRTIFAITLAICACTAYAKNFPTAPIIDNIPANDLAWFCEDVGDFAYEVAISRSAFTREERHKRIEAALKIEPTDDVTAIDTQLLMEYVSNAYKFTTDIVYDYADATPEFMELLIILSCKHSLKIKK